MFLYSCTKKITIETKSPIVGHSFPKVLKCPDPILIDEHSCKNAKETLKKRDENVHERVEMCRDSDNTLAECMNWIYGGNLDVKQ